MSRSENGSKKSGKKGTRKSASNTQVRDWSIRGAVAVVLVILLVLALQEFGVKQAASGTAAAWRGALRSKSENADLVKSEFDRITVQGKPSMTSDKAEANTVAAVTTNTYVWKGMVRSYTVKVLFGLGNDPPVEAIDGP